MKINDVRPLIKNNIVFDLFNNRIIESPLNSDVYAYGSPKFETSSLSMDKDNLIQFFIDEKIKIYKKAIDNKLEKMPKNIGFFDKRFKTNKFIKSRNFLKEIKAYQGNINSLNNRDSMMGNITIELLPDIDYSTDYEFQFNKSIYVLEFNVIDFSLNIHEAYLNFKKHFLKPYSNNFNKNMNEKYINHVFINYSIRLKHNGFLINFVGNSESLPFYKFDKSNNSLFYISDNKDDLLNFYKKSLDLNKKHLDILLGA